MIYHPSKYEWSSFQRKIFADISNGSGHSVVIARAGASKTTTLVEGVKYIPKRKKILMIAFNKRIQQELDERINHSSVKCSTLHSLGYQTVRQKFPKIKFDPNKSLNLINLYLIEKGYDKYDKLTMETANSLWRAINLCKSALQDAPSKIDDIIDRFDIETFLLERQDFIRAVCQVMGKCKATVEQCIDFQEMVWAPFVFNLKPEQFDRVFIDELNDLAPAQINLAISACKPDGRILAVGDPKQVCYGFNCVDIDVIEKFTKRIKAKVLDLPISYRCPTRVIKLAQEIVPDIQAAPGAKEGAIYRISEEECLNKIKPGDFLLSRFNAPLIYLCLALIKRGVRSNIAGRDVGVGLSWMIKRSEKKSIAEFLVWLEKWEETETKRLREKNRDPVLITDKAECLRNLCKNEKSIDGVLARIKDIFKDGDDTDKVILSSIHRSKGLERDRVFVLKNTLRPQMGGEELNLAYIAYSRSRDQLFIVG